MHAELAAEHGGADQWGYRVVQCGQISAALTHKDLAAGAPTEHNTHNKTKGDIKATTNDEPKSNSHDSNKAMADGNNKPNGQDQNGTPMAPKLEDSITVALAQGDTTQQNGGKDWERLPKQNKAAAKMLAGSGFPADLEWIDGGLIREYAEMGQPGFTETAQVHPFHFTTHMATLAERQGVSIRLNAHVTDIQLTRGKSNVDCVHFLDRRTNETNAITGVTDVVVAAGPWSGRLVPSCKVEGLRAHSVVFEADVSPYAIFTKINLPIDWVPPHRAAQGQKRRHRGRVDPEIYARPAGEVYACGDPDKTIPLPDTADQVECDEAQCDDLISYISVVSPRLASAPVTAKQACYIPRHMRFGDERSPLLGRTSVAGLWIAAGHTCWGIQNGPATGKLMSEFIFEGSPKSANIDELDPRKFKIGL